jgi:WD40 repeat protein
MTASKILLGSKLGPPPPTPGNYIAVGVATNPAVTLLDHTTAGSVSYLASVSLVSNGTVAKVGWSNDGNYLACGNGNTTGILTLFDHSTRGSLTVVASYTGATGSLSSPGRFSPNDDYVVYIANATITLLNHNPPGSLSLAATYVAASLGYDLDFSPDGNYIASGGGSYLVLLDHTTPGSLSLSATYVFGSPRAVRFSPSGDYIAVGNSVSPYLTILNHTTPGSLSFSSTANTSGFTGAVSWEPEENYLVSGGNNLKLLSHSAGSVSIVASYTSITIPNGISFSPASDYIAATFNSTTFTLLNRPTLSTLGLAATYTLRAAARDCAFSKI